MKIAYLHGLESNIDPKDPKIIFLNQNFSEVYTPSISYKDPSTFNKLLTNIKKLQPTLIVGSSMGGYVSYLIGAKLSIPTLVFNPAMVGRSMDPVVDSSGLVGSKNTVYFGKSDKVIDGNAVRKYFNAEGVGSFDYNLYSGGHRVPSDVFISAIKETIGITEIYNIENKIEEMRTFEKFIQKQQLTEVKQHMVSGTSARTITTLDNRKYELKKPVKGVRIGSFRNETLPKGTIIHNLPGGVFAMHPELEDRFKLTYSSQAPRWNHTFGVLVTSLPETLEAIEDSSKVLESTDHSSQLNRINESEVVYHQYDFEGMWAQKLGMTREEYVAHFATMTIGVDEAMAKDPKGKQFEVKGINFTYVERTGRFYGAYLYDVAKTTNVTWRAKLRSIAEVNELLALHDIKAELPYRYDEKELDEICKKISKMGIVCDYDDNFDAS